MPQTILMGSKTVDVPEITSIISVCSAYRYTQTTDKFKNLYVNAHVDGREDL